MGSHERFVYNDELMKKQAHIDRDNIEYRGSTSSYYKDLEELIRLLVGNGSPMIDESAVVIGNSLDYMLPSSYKNSSEFIMHSF